MSKINGNGDIVYRVDDPNVGKMEFPSFGSKSYRFHAEGARWAWIQADVKFKKSGKVADAALLICESDQGEHYATLLFHPEFGILEQGDEGFEQKVAAAYLMTEDDVFPYSYKFRDVPHCNDIHTDPETGWSN